MNKEVTHFAKTNFRNQDAVFGIKTDDRRRHMYVIGKTGMGKTNLLENLAIQDIRNGHGVAFIDPHGDSSEKLISMIPKERINDVIYFNPADQKFPIAFNVMEAVDPEYRHLIASGLVGVFKKIWADSWGPRLEYILRNTILALLEYPGSTMLGIMRMLVDKKYRQRVIAKSTDPVVKSFWVDEFTQWNQGALQEVISPIQNKVGQFLSSSLIRNIVGQTKSSFDVRSVMDNQKILIMNLSKGRMGEDISALLGAMMITKIQLAAMERVDIPEEERRDFYLYVDEFQNFATESFANILSEARKYRLNLILANQYITQLEEPVRDSIFGNAGTLISFRVGAADAEFMEKEFEPIFTMIDLVNLPKYCIYLKLMIDGIAGDAFSATTLPPIENDASGSSMESAVKVSRERYATPKDIVEEKIARWSGVFIEGTFTPPKEVLKTSPPFSPQKISPSGQKIVQKNKVMEGKTMVTEKKTQGMDRAVYPAVCATCDADISVPFKPDGARKTFCKECLKDYQRMMARAQVGQEEHAKDQEQENENKDQRSEEQKQTKTIEKKVYLPQEAPLKLSQMQNMEPRKFSRSRKKPEVDLAGVRGIIEKSRAQ